MVRKKKKKIGETVNKVKRKYMDYGTKIASTSIDLSLHVLCKGFEQVLFKSFQPKRQLGIF